MKKNMLQGLQWKPLQASHIGAIKGCLDFLKYSYSLAWVYGGLGQAFSFNLSEPIYPSASDIRKSERFYKLLRNLGCDVKTVYGHKSQDDFAEVQKRAWELIKLGINAGFPCYGWELYHPAYYLIYGYDQNRYYFNGPGSEEKPESKLWMELGDTNIGIIDMHALRPIQPANNNSLVKQVLQFAVEFSAESLSKLTEESVYAYLKTAFQAYYEARHYAVEFLKEAREKLLAELSNSLLSFFDRAIENYMAIYKVLNTFTEQLPLSAAPNNYQENIEMQELVLLRDAEINGLESLQKIAKAL